MMTRPFVTIGTILALAAAWPAFSRAEIVWKTWRSEAVGASIATPSDWKQENAKGALRLLAPNSQDTGASITVSVQDIGLDPAAKASKAAISAQYGKIENESEEPIAGRPARSFAFRTSDDDPVRGKMSFIEFGSRVYMIDCEADKKSFPKYEALFARAASSLSVIGQSSIPPLAASVGKSAPSPSPASGSDVIAAGVDSPAASNPLKNSPPNAFAATRSMAADQNGPAAPKTSAGPAPTSEGTGSSDARPEVEPSATTREDSAGRGADSWVAHRDNRLRIFASAPSPWLVSATQGTFLGEKAKFLFLRPPDRESSQARVAVSLKQGPLAGIRAWAKGAILGLDNARIQRSVAIRMESGKLGYVYVFTTGQPEYSETGMLTLISSGDRVLLADCRARTSAFSDFNEAFNRIVGSIRDFRGP